MEWICVTAGVVGGFLTTLFGGSSPMLLTLLILMAADWGSGLLLAGVFHKSKKSKSGALESRAGLKGLAKKGMILLFVLVAHRLDLALGTTYIRDAAVIGFAVNELLSIVENAGLMGLPLPDVITNGIALLKGRKKGENDAKDTKDADNTAQAEPPQKPTDPQ